MRTLLLLSVLLIGGCSTIVNGTFQEVKFEVPSNQVCYITQGKKMVASIAESTTLKLERSSQSVIVDCGTTKKTYIADLTVEGWTSIAFIDFGLVDYLTGAIWEYKEVEQ